MNFNFLEAKIFNHTSNLCISLCELGKLNGGGRISGKLNGAGSLSGALCMNLLEYHTSNLCKSLCELGKLNGGGRISGKLNGAGSLSGTLLVVRFILSIMHELS